MVTSPSWHSARGVNQDLVSVLNLVHTCVKIAVCVRKKTIPDDSFSMIILAKIVTYMSLFCKLLTLSKINILPKWYMWVQKTALQILKFPFCRIWLFMQRHYERGCTFPKIHLWCYTWQPLHGQHHSWSLPHIHQQRWYLEWAVTRTKDERATIVPATRLSFLFFRL